MNAYENEQYNKDSLTKMFSENHDLNVIYVAEGVLPTGGKNDGLAQWIELLEEN